MKPFTFRLATLARLREAERDARRQELLAAMAHQTRLLEGLDRLHSEFGDCHNRNRQTRSGSTLTPAQLVAQERFLSSLEAQRRELDAQLASAAEQIEFCRRRLAEAECKVQALDRLRQRRFEQHQLQMARRATSELDEVAARRHLLRAG
jgi:flagellar export protein FliJ